jgi:hypothetical protein
VLQSVRRIDPLSVSPPSETGTYLGLFTIIGLEPDDLTVLHMSLEHTAAPTIMTTTRRDDGDIIVERF